MVNKNIKEMPEIPNGVYLYKWWLGDHPHPRLFLMCTFSSRGL